MTIVSRGDGRTLRLRERMSQREVDRPPRLGQGWWDSKVRGEFLEEEPWARSPDVLQDPGRSKLQRILTEAADAANGRAHMRLVEVLPPDPIMNHPHGLLEDNGLPDSTRYGFSPRTSAVGVAWFTRAGVKYVRAWGVRGYITGAEHAYLFLPEFSDEEGVRSCWAAVFPRRFFRLRDRRQERLQRILERIGPPGEDDRVNLNLRTAKVRAHVPGVGVILSDDLVRPQLVQVVVRDPSTGTRHHLSVPPRFGNPRSKTFEKLGSPRPRIQAAVAWTFGMKPHEYTPALEA